MKILNFFLDLYIFIYIIFGGNVEIIFNIFANLPYDWDKKQQYFKKNRQLNFGNEKCL